jgi:hypothetical protein
MLPGDLRSQVAVDSRGCRAEARQPPVMSYLRVVMPVVETPPPLEVRVIRFGGGMLVKNT